MSLGRRFHSPGRPLLALAGPFGNIVLLQLVIGTLDQLLQLNAALQIIPLCPFRGPITHQLLVGNANGDYHVGPNREAGKLVVPLHLPFHETPLPNLPLLLEFVTDNSYSLRPSNGVKKKYHNEPLIIYLTNLSVFKNLFTCLLFRSGLDLILFLLN